MKKRSIAIVTGGRADYGLLRPLLRALADDPAFDLKIIATGMHLIPEQGETWRDIEIDGFSIAAKVDMQITGDSAVAISRAISAGITGMAEFLEKQRPDILVLLGDRFEVLAAAIAAMVARVPVAHIHGGEATEGLIDESIRHSVTKMAQVHFTATEEYRRRVIQLGENPEHVHCVGAIGLDNIRQVQLLDRPSLERALGIEMTAPTFLVTYHPVTLEDSSSSHAEALIAALDSFPEARIVITLPNADTDSAGLRDQLSRYAARRKGHVVAFAALGTQRYLSVLGQCDVVVGNSSSGLIEAPSFRVPTVNIGERQRGRIAPASVIHCTPDSLSIRQAIVQALDPGFRSGLRGLVNPYGDGKAAPRIVGVLRTLPLGGGLIKKRFYDLTGIAA